jgi:hypothetical protein
MSTDDTKWSGQHGPDVNMLTVTSRYDLRALTYSWTALADAAHKDLRVPLIRQFSSALRSAGSGMYGDTSDK